MSTTVPKKQLHQSPPPDAEDLLDEALAEPVLTGEEGIEQATTYAAAFLVLAVASAAAINAWSPLRAEPSALLVHLASALALYAVARRVLQARTELAAMACGMVFAAHPMAVTAVQAPALSPLIATLLGLLAIALTLSATDAARPRADLTRAGMGWVAYIVAALVHPVAIPTAVLVPILHRARKPLPVHADMRLITGAYGLGLGFVLVASPYLYPASLDPATIASVFNETLLLLFGLVPFSIWHPVPSPVYTLGLATPVVIATVFVIISLFRRTLSGAAILWILLVSTAVASFPGSAVPFEAALYPAIAALALLAGALLHALGRIPVAGPIAAMVTTISIATLGISSYTRHAQWIDPTAPWYAATEIYPNLAHPRLVLAQHLLAQAEEASGASDFARGRTPVVLRAGDARSHYQTALRYAEDALDLRGDLTDAMVVQGMSLIGLNRPGDAADVLFQALRHAPERLDVARGLARAYAASGDQEAARKAADYFESVARRLPGDEYAARAYLSHLRFHGMLGRMAAARDIAVPEAFEPVLRDLVITEQAVSRGFQGAPFGVEPLTAFAEARRERAQPMQAFYALQEAVRRDPAGEAAWLQLGELAAEMGVAANFINEHGEALPATPSNWRSMALEVARAGHWEAAEMYRFAPNPGGELAIEAWLDLLDEALEQRAVAAARDFLQEAVRAGARESLLEQRRQRLGRIAPAEW